MSIKLFDICKSYRVGPKLVKNVRSLSRTNSRCESACSRCPNVQRLRHVTQCNTFIYTLRQSKSLSSLSSMLDNLNNYKKNSGIKSVDELAKTAVLFSPKQLQPYLKLARVDKPVGFWLLMWPGFAGLALGAGGMPSLLLIGKFAVGAVLMRSIGCTINDVWDKDFDLKVERTRSRPLPSGDLTVNEALISGGVQSAAALAILLSLNGPTIGLGLVAVPLVVSYPYLKQITYYPQMFLGLCMNYGLLMGFTAASTGLTLATAAPVLTMYASLISWTVFYDTIYALQDKQDDLLLGLKSTAIKFGPHVDKYLCLFSGITSVGLFSSGVLAQLGPCYYVGVGYLSHLLWNQARTLRKDDKNDCLVKFKENAKVGITLFFSVLFGSLFPF